VRARPAPGTCCGHRVPVTNTPMTVLIVGATGSLVVDESLRQGHVVRALVRTTNKAREVNAQAQAIIGEVTRPNSGFATPSTV
jgi:uncharacterized protein YbjT (DUF2867 family)